MVISDDRDNHIRIHFVEARPPGHVGHPRGYTRLDAGDRAGADGAVRADQGPPLEIPARHAGDRLRRQKL